jgi:RNA polymerase sigma factor (sigma-70 family)
MADEPSTLSQLVDEAILTQAFMAAWPRLVAMAQRRVGAGLAARVDPEGVVQNAFLRARQRWTEATEKPADVHCWIYGIVRDQATDEIRAALGPNRDAGRDQPWPDGSVAQLALRLIPSQTGPSTAAARNELVEQVRLAVMRLKPVEQEIVSMHYFDDLTFAQIGAILGMTANAANVRCVRALLKLRKFLPSHGA